MLYIHVQYSTVQYSTVQYSTVHYSKHTVTIQYIVSPAYIYKTPGNNII